ncbi:sensor histidine kinase [Aliikangiella coralliicola]|uniref:Sensor histidine kinase n=1 Tax=Aliikangiella coralliicola TaxID=2592383 RepID=A0A545U930_9GAMM|nr:sensor histidine kinase [Aliikangiella coralliicola]TQV85981.1 sensor histidine kinase [Aliikangiella coralliicola]
MKQQPLELYLGLVTWLGVALLTFSAWNGEDISSLDLNNTNISIVASLFILYLIGSLACDVNFEHPKRSRVRNIGTIVSTLAFLALVVFFQYPVVGILAIIIVVQIVEFYGQKLAWAAAILFPVSGALIDGVIKEIPYAYQGILLYALFNFFALLTKSRFISEQHAKNRSLQLVRELKATQILLSSAIKRDERLRISQDLHDVIGHHLTALSLQLEVASHVKETEIQQHIQRAKAITGLLLSDIRETVSEIRPDKNLDLEEALKTLTQDITNLDVELNYQLPTSISEPRLAEVIFRCVQEAITNTLKHANASRCTVDLSLAGQEIILTIADNGLSEAPIKKGNGLTGMSERVNNLDGQLNIENMAEEFLLTVRLPYRYSI